MSTAEPPSRSHPVDRARLTDFAPLAPPVHHYRPAERHTDLVRHYWVPVWDLPAAPVTEHVLQYPSCLVVVSNTYARFYGVVAGRSQVELSGRGWAVGVTLQPGAGPAVFGGRDLSHLRDSHVDLSGVPSMAPAVNRVRAMMEGDPGSAWRHRSSIKVLERLLDGLDPVSDEGQEVTRWVSLVESDPPLRTVADLVRRADVSERTLQRIVRRHLGLTPQWLIQRRRLHEATDRLKHGTASLADLAHELGYTDQAHFTRDFRTVTGYSPGAFARLHSHS
ncbi:MAG: helix-turn-helix domain-containing protein [Ornithinimicrobium sp.]